MPIYEYACSHCGYQVDIFQKISDEALSVCEKCQQKTLIKLMSAPGFRLKGGGWYETDFKTANDKQKNLVEKTEPEKAEVKKTEVKKVETKAATKTDNLE
jgi:putative FmdB family regulatory protein